VPASSARQSGLTPRRLHTGAARPEGQHVDEVTQRRLQLEQTGVSGDLLVQQYEPARDGKVLRLETLDRRFLYALEIDGGGAFDLCLRGHPRPGHHRDDGH
jgi:hypothetical protein